MAVVDDRVGKSADSFVDTVQLKGKCWHDFHAKCCWHDFWHKLVNRTPKE
jgi:hypothetical protein